MYEIELKAWLDDRKSVTKILNETARYDGIHDKTDTYWLLQQSGTDGAHENAGRRITIRIRKETVKMGDNGTPSTVFIVTYKRHTKNTSPSGETYEVNDEKEFELPTEDAAESFRTFLEDAGFRVSLNKHKIAEGWYDGDYHIEICTVEKLGDFIEIETLAQNDEPATVQARQKGILDILDRCKVPRNRIEERYYRELLEEKQNENKAKN